MKLKSRLINHWKTSVAGIALIVGYWFWRDGHINFSDFKEYVALIPTIVLLFMKDK